jgi:TRAP-type C4-dicarboxylate transport system permease small subunit
MGLIGMALALDYEDHVSISFLVDKLNPKLKKIIKYISEIVLFYFLFIVIKEGFVLALESNAKSYMLQYPIKYSLLSVPVCFLLMFIFLIKNVLRRVFPKRQSYPSMDRVNNKGKEEAL